eukprot:TRINITY_DN416_c0_g2_i1.p1 TRINITY_DN416_c0_g2~~TRINITY_DN416_c0_g2_i1.p1  ORF type:complete len:222 (+),score=47.19 TRINITY_DN416_c0_g2_i1:162-827(+)
MGGVCSCQNSVEVAAPNGVAPQAAHFRHGSDSYVEWDRKFPAMTLAQLQKKRQEFWETQVEGDPNMWQAIKLSTEAEDEVTARAILDSSGLTPWDMETSDALFCYDPTGKRYVVPLWVLHLPRNLLPDEAAATPTPQPILIEEKGVDLNFKIRLSTGTDVEVVMKSTDTITEVKKRIANQLSIATDRQRAIFSGGILQDGQQLGAVGIKDGVVLQVMVRPA